MQQVTFLGDYINGTFVKGERPQEDWISISPADFSDEVLSLNCTYEHVDQAVEAAKSAYRKWAHLTLDERKAYLLKLKEVYSQHVGEMAELIARETGKPLWEAKTEAGALAGKIGVTLEHSIKLVENVHLENALPGVDGVIRYKSRGVMAVVGPFNFPAHLPNGHIIPALITGNTVVLKPSEKTPAVGQFMAQMFDKAGLPKGVFNLVQGQAETSKRLVGHSDVDGVLFTGSYEVGLKIKEATLSQYWKLLALEMGGKNVAVVWEDADIEKAVYENIVGGFVTAGQRCSCTSKIVLHPAVKDKFLRNYIETVKKLKIGHWSENPFMGPVISRASMENCLKFQDIAAREGSEVLLKAEQVKASKDGFYVSPSINLVQDFDKDSVYQSSEIFGPNVAVIETDDFDQALEINNSTGYGLVMSVFSKNKALYEQALIDAKVGLVNWNRTTNGASSRLPFGGMGKSGNDRPSAHFAVQYCTVPVGSLEDTTSFDAGKVFPGVDYSYKG